MRFWPRVWHEVNWHVAEDRVRPARLGRFVAGMRIGKARIPRVNAIIFASGSCQEISWAVLQPLLGACILPFASFPLFASFQHVGEWLSLVEHLVRDTVEIH